MSARAAQRLAFARAALGRPEVGLVPASSDASFRSYWRTTGCTPSRIVMDAPPDKEDLGPFLDVAERLRRADIPAPEVLARDEARGFLLLTDLGQRLLRAELTAERVDARYRQAMDLLLCMQRRTEAGGLPPYDESRLVAEMELMPQWFLLRHLGITPACEDWDRIESAFRALLDAALSQPRCFVHRDFHSRNLMVLEDDRLAVIDFQDAVLGPLTYDLVSLLRDCYVEWPDEQVEAWAEHYRNALHAAGIAVPGRDAFLRAFDLMGLQRHIKVLGIFCRLWYRDGKPGYLADLPRVWGYVQRIGRRHAETKHLIEQLERWIGDRDLSRAAD
ncbi:MAG: aminoglycoside phosphotransferase [Lysobacteraceae bacterium]|nr:MAG: aminoglycoside phosphotransferase [Xanthomonadaceae bacterium]